MTDHAYDDEEDPNGYREHIARLEKERIWLPIAAAVLGLVVYYLKGTEFSEAEQAILAAVGLGVWAVFNEVRATRIETLKCRAHNQKVKAFNRVD